MVDFPQIKLAPSSSYPDPGIAVVYSDYVGNMTYTSYVVKMYFIRADANLTNISEAKPVISGQVIMPLEGFVNTALFFEEQLAVMRKSGLVTDALIATVQAARKVAR